jgi:hypothetical protein
MWQTLQGGVSQHLHAFIKGEEDAPTHARTGTERRVVLVVAEVINRPPCKVHRTYLYTVGILHGGCLDILVVGFPVWCAIIRIQCVSLQG